MRKLLCSLALITAVGTLVTVGSPAPAQQKDKKDEKKDDKKDIKKDDKKDDKEEKVGTIEVYQSKDGWRYRVIGPDGKSIAIGVQGFAKKEDCLAVVDLLKATMAKGRVTEMRDKNDKK